ncbi:protein of unknown function [Actinoplanes philippinensis]|uniref:DUF4360 domain-containing protein n=1 Tax=Actinoplanes philippinensis TaxID=35752 RepID=A0A1I2I172_9ACTN|nr:DUF4360 domain-containing protein [Actinoplanes philippinensis]SFF35932.1 protein of unknown function [Actinoplanes philippinensis]
MLHTVATGTALLASLAATAVVPSSSLASAPPPGKVTVTVVSANGSGCPAGTTGVSASARGASFKVTYRAFTASAGGGASALDFRKNCQLALSVSARKGWTWAISRIASTGSATLRSGASATQVTSFYWAGDSRTGRVSQAFTGPLSGPWQRVKKVATRDLIYQPCGQRRNLNVNIELRVRSGAAGGRNVLTLDSTSGSTFSLVWRRC